MLSHKKDVKGSVYVSSPENQRGFIGVNAYIEGQDQNKIEAVIEQLQTYLTTVAEDVEKFYNFTCRAWEHKPKFTKTIISGQDLHVAVYLDEQASQGKTRTGLNPAQLYALIETGAKAHLIEAKNKATYEVSSAQGTLVMRRAKPMLVFKYPYSSSSMANSFNSVKHSVGDNYAIKPSVNHPGFEGRNYTERISSIAETVVARDGPKIIEKTLYDLSVRGKVSNFARELGKQAGSLFK